MRVDRHPGVLEEGWQRRVLVLWEEDDSGCYDRETPAEALRRMSGKFGAIDPHRERPTVSVEDEDTTYSFYRDGWVRGCCCGLGFVGVLVEEAP